jgi:Fe-S-cluster containining protein
MIYGGLSAESFHYFCNSKIFHTMNYSGTISLAPYHQLRKEIDKLCDSLEKKHHQHMNCRKGCDLCCMAISVFPVEFFAIRAELEHNPISGLPVPDREEDCRFLVDHSCSIYPSRPVICRTHGLPLLYMSLESDEYELSLCELNFTAYDLEDFDEKNTFPMDRINSKLYQINKNFIAGFDDGKYTEQDRIPLADLSSLVNEVL